MIKVRYKPMNYSTNKYWFKCPICDTLHDFIGASPYRCNACGVVLPCIEKFFDKNKEINLAKWHFFLTELKLGEMLGILE